jgi:hypothetical protein
MPNRNGEIHEGIIDILRFNLPTIFEQKFEHFVVIADEGIMASFANSGNGKGIRPDLLISYGKELIFIEVGQLDIDKWEHINNPIIHISHNKAVGLISGDLSIEVQEILNACRNLLGVY